MNIFDKFRKLADAGRALEVEFGAFFNVVMEDILSSTEAVINGQRVILAGTNNYLGLSMDPECIRAACRATEREGTGTTGSRMACPNSGVVCIQSYLQPGMEPTLRCFLLSPDLVMW